MAMTMGEKCVLNLYLVRGHGNGKLTEISLLAAPGLGET